ncbi:putative dormancy/auxin associated protein [Dioscorea sansibarensis]
MGLLDKLWDDTVAGPRPENGLGKLRKTASLSPRPSSSKGLFVGEELADEPKVTRSIMIKRPAGCPSPGNGTPPPSPAGTTPPISPFSGGREWNRLRRKSSSDAQESGGAMAVMGTKTSSSSHEV